MRCSRRLEEKGRYEWVYEECAELGDIERYRMDERRAYLRIPGAMRMSRRELGILNELVKLRDDIARERDFPVRYILPDDVVAGLATTKPARLDDFAQLRRFDGGMKRQLGPAILEAVARGQALPTRRPSAAARAGPRRRRATRWSRCSALATAEIAREAGLPSSLLVPRAALERIAREIPRDRAQLRTRPGAAALAARAGRGSALAAVVRAKPRFTIEGYASGDPKVRLSDEPPSE